MSKQVAPETGETGRQARASLVELLFGIVLLSILLNALVNLWPTPPFPSQAWWIRLAILIGLVILALYLLVHWDDRRVGRYETRIEVLIPYVIGGSNRRVVPGGRRSYPATVLACESWQAAFERGWSRQDAKVPSPGRSCRSIWS